MAAAAGAPVGRRRGGDAGEGGGGASAPPTRPGDDDARGDWLTRLLTWLRDLLTPGINNAVGFPWRERSEVAAKERLMAIREHGSDWVRFIERSPGEERDRSEKEEFSQASAQTYILQWQSQAPELLLLARTADAVLSTLFELSERPESPLISAGIQSLNPVVSIHPLPRLLARVRPRLFPWRVVVSTTQPQLLRDELARLGDWLGIGVDVVAGAPISAFSRCQVDGGLDGTVAGSLRDIAGRELPLACEHVLSPGCVSAIWRRHGAGVGNQSAVNDEPDAALLQTGACLATGRQHADELKCADYRQLTEIMGSGRLVSRIGGAHSGTQGTPIAGQPISSPAAMLTPDGLGGVNRFPSIVITRRRRRFRWNRRPFSREGDSGSWVVDLSERTWLGMVLGGNEDVTVALTASCLLDYLATLEPSPLAEGDVQCLTTL